MSNVMSGHEFYNWFDREVCRCAPVWAVNDGSGWETEPYVSAANAEEAAVIWDDNNNPHGVEGVAGQPWRDGSPTRVQHIWLVETQGGVEMFVHEDECNMFVGPFNTIEEAQEALHNYRP